MNHRVLCIRIIYVNYCYRLKITLSMLIIEYCKYYIPMLLVIDTENRSLWQYSRQKSELRIGYFRRYILARYIEMGDLLWLLLHVCRAQWTCPFFMHPFNCTTILMKVVATGCHDEIISVIHAVLAENTLVSLFLRFWLWFEWCTEVTLRIFPTSHHVFCLSAL